MIIYNFLHFSIFIYNHLLFSTVFSNFPRLYCYSLFILFISHSLILYSNLMFSPLPPVKPPPEATIRNRRSRFLLFCKERSDLQNPLFAMNCNERSEICKNCKNKDRFVQIASFCKNIVKILQILQKRFAKILQKLYF